MMCSFLWTKGFIALGQMHRNAVAKLYYFSLFNTLKFFTKTGFLSILILQNNCIKMLLIVVTEFSAIAVAKSL